MEGTGSPENTPATVRDFPASALTLSGRASIFGGTPVEEENKIRGEGCYICEMMIMISDNITVKEISHNFQGDGLKSVK